jgi:hypothetical protein
MLTPLRPLSLRGEGWRSFPIRKLRGVRFSRMLNSCLLYVDSRDLVDVCSLLRFQVTICRFSLGQTS